MATPPGTVMASGDVIDGTVRLMGTDAEGVQYFVFKTTPDDEVCLMVVPPGDDGASGCSATLPIALTYRDIRAVLNEDPVQPADDITVVGEYVQVSR